MPVPMPLNHDSQYVKYDNNKFDNHFDNKFENNKVQWNGPGYSGMNKPTYGTAYPQFDEQMQVPPMMKKNVNYTETYGQWPMNQPTTYGPYQPQPEPFLPEHAGWSKNFVKQQCTMPVHMQYGCGPDMPYNCNYDYPITRDIKYPVPMPTPVPVPVTVPVPIPVQPQYPQPQYPQQWTQPQYPVGQWPVQWQNQLPITQWQNQLPVQWQQDMPYPNQWNKDIKYPIGYPTGYPTTYPTGQPQPTQYGPTNGLRHTQLTTTRW